MIFSRFFYLYENCYKKCIYSSIYSTESSVTKNDSGFFINGKKFGYFVGARFRFWWIFNEFIQNVAETNLLRNSKLFMDIFHRKKYFFYTKNDTHSKFIQFLWIVSVLCFFNELLSCNNIPSLCYVGVWIICRVFKKIKPLSLQRICELELK